VRERNRGELPPLKLKSDLGLKPGQTDGVHSTRLSLVFLVFQFSLDVPSFLHAVGNSTWKVMPSRPGLRFKSRVISQESSQDPCVRYWSYGRIALPCFAPSSGPHPFQRRRHRCDIRPHQR
jgi:hypothetical protein